jgi:hypothetical protein
VISSVGVQPGLMSKSSSMFRHQSSAANRCAHDSLWSREIEALEDV